MLPRGGSVRRAAKDPSLARPEAPIGASPLAPIGASPLAPTGASGRALARPAPPPSQRSSGRMFCWNRATSAAVVQGPPAIATKDVKRYNLVRQSSRFHWPPEAQAKRSNECGCRYYGRWEDWWPRHECYDMMQKKKWFIISDDIRTRARRNWLRLLRALLAGIVLRSELQRRLTEQAYAPGGCGMKRAQERFAEHATKRPCVHSE